MKNKFDPKMDHLSNDVWKNVYEPNTDTYIFVDALQKDIESIIKLNPKIILEIGFIFEFIIALEVDTLPPFYQIF